jgi:hypothetical protein
VSVSFHAYRRDGTRVATRQRGFASAYLFGWGDLGSHGVQCELIVDNEKNWIARRMLDLKLAGWEKWMVL